MAYNGNNYSRGNGYSDNRNNRNNGYGGNRNGGYNSNRSNGYGDNRNGGNRQNNDEEQLKPKTLPADYVGEAQTIMTEYQNEKNKITTSKIRSILSMISDIYNDESRRSAEKKLSSTSLNKLQLLRIRMVYEYGRNPTDVKPFIIKSHLISYLLDIGDDREKFIRYARYMEALVAYHRFYGGHEN